MNFFKTALIPLLLFLVVCAGCRPKFAIRGYFINDTADTVVLNSHRHDTLLPHDSIRVTGVWDNNYPDRNFKCCPCELGYESIIVVRTSKKITKDISNQSNWDLTTSGSRKSRVIGCSFNLRQSDIVP